MLNSNKISKYNNNNTKPKKYWVQLATDKRTKLLCSKPEEESSRKSTTFV